MPDSIFPIIQIAVSVLLIIVILLQNKGAGLSETFGGGGAYSYRTKRGLEKILSRLTVVFMIILAGLSVTLIVIN